MLFGRPVISPCSSVCRLTVCTGISSSISFSRTANERRFRQGGSSSCLGLRSSCLFLMKFTSSSVCYAQSASSIIRATFFRSRFSMILRMIPAKLPPLARKNCANAVMTFN